MKKGSKHSEETKRKISENHADMSGEKNHNFGKPLSEETRIKLSLANKGKTPWLGKHHSEETRKKMSVNHVDISGEKNPNFGKTGENNPRWNPNLTDEDRQDRRLYPAYNEWRLQVFDRDNFTCQKCGSKKSRPLNAHHIEGYSFNKELRTVVDNGITFCKKCHKDFHHIYGNESNTEKVNEFLKENM